MLFGQMADDLRRRFQVVRDVTIYYSDRGVDDEMEFASLEISKVCYFFFPWTGTILQ